MDESGEESTIACSVNPSPPSEVNRQRRSIQTKLPWSVQSRGGGDEFDGGNKGKTRRKRESLPKGSKKSLAGCNEESKLNKGSKRSCVLKKFPERSPQIKQKQEQDEATLKVTSSEQCKATESKHKGLNDNQKTIAALKDSTSSVLECKEPCLRTLASIKFDATVSLDDQRRHLQQPGSNLQLEGNAEIKDEFIGLHWGNWVFENKTPNSDGYYAPKHASSIFEGSVKPLELDTACHTELHLDGILAKTNFTTLGIAPSHYQNDRTKMSNSVSLRQIMVVGTAATAYVSHSDITIA